MRAPILDNSKNGFGRYIQFGSVNLSGIGIHLGHLKTTNGGLL